MISVCVPALWNSREVLYLRDALKAQSRMWQPSIHPGLQSQLGPGCSWQMFLLSLGPSFLHVSRFLVSSSELYGLNLSPTAF